MHSLLHRSIPKSHSYDGCSYAASDSACGTAVLACLHERVFSLTIENKLPSGILGRRFSLRSEGSFERDEEGWKRGERGRLKRDRFKGNEKGTEKESKGSVQRHRKGWKRGERDRLKPRLHPRHE